MTDEELKKLVSNLALAQQETDRQLKQSAQEADRRAQEADRRAQEIDRRMKKTDRQLMELGKQIGGLGEKFGSFTEGLALPSMSKILSERFGMETISPSVRVSRQGQHLEIDVLAYANSDINEAYVVEVKSHVREEAIEQLRRILERFRQFFPEHKDKKVYGILAAVDVSTELRERILQAGFYAASIHNEVFALDVPATFKPKAY